MERRGLLMMKMRCFERRINDLKRNGGEGVALLRGFEVDRKTEGID